MQNTSQIIVVFGATGLQGGQVVKHLLSSNWKVRAITRNPESDAAKRLKNLKVEVFKADMKYPESLLEPLKGAYGVFSVQNFWEAGFKDEIIMGKNVADLAQSNDVKHFVYTSVGGAERNIGLAPWESKWQIESYIKAKGIPCTIIRPVVFMENYYIPQIEKSILRGRLIDGIREDKKNQFIATDDIGKFVNLVFSYPEKFIGQEIEIAGDELTNIQIAKTFSKVMGRKVKFKKIPSFMIRLLMGKLFYNINKWFNESGFQAKPSLLKENYPKMQWTTFEQWLKIEGWDKKLIEYIEHEKINNVLSHIKINPKEIYKMEK